jgi:hypothetical protein
MATIVSRPVRQPFIQRQHSYQSSIRTMKITEILCILGATLIIASCGNSSTDPAPTPTGKDTTTHGNDTTDPHPVVHNVPVHEKTYDATRGGVQIAAIYYDQNANKDSFGLAVPEEWIILKSDKKVNTTGWHLDGGSGDGQRYALPDTINGRLYIFTQQGSVPANVTTGGARMSLRLNTWIWNNSDHDVATIYDGSGVVVDRLSY